MHFFQVMASKKWNLALMAGVMLLAGGTSHAATLTWTGVVSTEALNPLNWNPAQAPSETDSLVIQLGTVVFDNDLTVQGLTLSTGTILSGAGNVTVTNNFTMRDATLSGTGTLTIGEQANGSIESAEVTPFTQNLFERTVYNNGVLGWNTGKIVLNKDFYNQPSGIFNINTDANMQSSLPQAQKATFNNAGQFIKVGAVNQTTLAVYMNNSGIVQVLKGRLNLGPRYIQTGGQTKLDGGNINGSGGASQQYLGGALNGSGIITGNVLVDGGIVSPGHSPGAITINGNYTQTANGTLDMEIAGTTAGTQYDQLIINGTANLAGTLNLTMLNGFLPKAGDNFQLLTYYSSIGSWANYTGFSPTPSITFTKTQTPTYFIATVQASQIVDSTPPTVVVTSPTSGLVAKANPVVSGTAADEAGGSGLASKTLLLYRYAVGSVTAGYWNGSAWDATYNATTHEKALSGTTFSWTYTLPTLADGKYYVRATAKDNGGNVKVSPSMIFTIDKTVPTVLTVTSPATTVWVPSLEAIYGTATDNTNGSGLDRVELSIKRNSNNNYWTDSGWVTNGQYKKADSDSAMANGWVRRHSTTAPLPQGANLPNGAYTITTNAYDKAGNVKTLATTFNVDATLPTITVTAPVNNAVYTTQPAATGTVADTGGSGVASVKVRLYRYATATVAAGYWAGGTTWSASYSAANDRLASGTSNWSLTLPTLTNGNYAFEAVAADKAGNSTVSPLIFFSKSAGTSTISISIPSANVTSNTLTLPFTGALDATVATDITRYSVIKSGISIAVQSASYNATTKIVTLSLPAGSLSAGSAVTVSWAKLFDTSGKIVSGSSNVTP